MAYSAITPVLLAGGSGTRLWPLSRRSYPKQFVPLTGALSLFQHTARRLSGQAVEAGRWLAFAKPLVLTNSDFRFIVTEQLAEMGIDPGAILIEPEGRNTGPAILAAALHLLDQNRHLNGVVATGISAPQGRVHDRLISRYDLVDLAYAKRAVGIAGGGDLLTVILTSSLAAGMSFKNSFIAASGQAHDIIDQSTGHLEIALLENLHRLTPITKTASTVKLDG